MPDTTSFLDAQHLIRDLLDVAGDTVTMLRPARERFQDQQVERACSTSALFWP